MSDLARDGLDHLDTGGADADDADTLAGEVDRLLRPPPGVEELPLERFPAGEQDARGAESMPQQAITNCVSIVSPVSVLTVQRSVVLVVMGAGDRCC